MRKLPIILIPGIQGTTLSNVNEQDFVKVYSGIKKYFKRVSDIELQADGISDKEIDMVINPSDVEDLAYSEIVDLLRRLGFRVYIFGYDWRLSNEVNAANLHQFVERLSQKLHNTNKFNFLTHSMGGLVLAAYMKRLQQEGRLDEVLGRAIMCAPPFLGSLEAAISLVIGRSRFVNSSDDFRKVARTFPSIYELCPVYPDAFTYASDPNKAIDYFDYRSYWQHEARPAREDGIMKNELMEHRFQELGNVRTDGDHHLFDLAQLDADIKQRLLVLVGSNEDTLATVMIKDQNGHDRLQNYFDFQNALENEEGDGTVHHKSSTIFKDTITTIEIKSIAFETRRNSNFFMYDWHAFFLNNGRVQNIIRRFMEFDFPTLADINGPLDWFTSPGNAVRKL